MPAGLKKGLQAVPLGPDRAGSRRHPVPTHSQRGPMHVYTMRMQCVCRACTTTPRRRRVCWGARCSRSRPAGALGHWGRMRRWCHPWPLSGAKGLVLCRRGRVGGGGSRPKAYPPAGPLVLEVGQVEKGDLTGRERRERRRRFRRRRARRRRWRRGAGRQLWRRTAGRRTWRRRGWG